MDEESNYSQSESQLLLVTVSNGSKFNMAGLNIFFIQTIVLYSNIVLYTNNWVKVNNPLNIIYNITVTDLQLVNRIK